MLRRIVFAALLLLASTLTSQAQTQRKYAPVGFCTSSSLGSAVGLTSFTGTACSNQPPSTFGSYTYAAVCAYVSSVVWRDDGIAPTATPGSGGQGISAGSCMPYYGNLSSLQIIQQAAGAIVGVSIYQ